MVAINLLPDVRQAKNRDQHRRQLAIGLGTLAVIVSGGAVLAMYLILGGMKLQIQNLTNQINDRQAKLEQVKDLPAALTLQQHLASLPSLYAQRTSFNHFLAVLSAATPGEVKLDSVSVDPTGNLSISGTATSYAMVGKYTRSIMASPGVDVPRLVPLAASGANFKAVVINGTSGSAPAVGFTVTAMIDPGVTNVQN